MAAGAKVHVPACSEDGDFLPLQCVASRCFCVDANGTNVGPAGGAVSCKNQTKHLTLSHHHSTRVSTSGLGQESVQQQRNWSRSLLTYASVCFRFREDEDGVHHRSDWPPLTNQTWLLLSQLLTHQLLLTTSLPVAGNC